MTRIGQYLRHSLEVRRTAYGAPDAEGLDYGHGTAVVATVGTFAGLIQPRSAKERASATGEAASLGSFRCFLEAAAIGLVSVDDVIRKGAVAPGADLAGDYQVRYLGNAAGQDHHLELDLERLDP